MELKSLKGRHVTLVRVRLMADEPPSPRRRRRPTRGARVARPHMQAHQDRIGQIRSC
jgi:hypothetical protein